MQSKTTPAAAASPARRRWLGWGAAGTLSAAGAWWLADLWRGDAGRDAGPLLATVQRGNIEDLVTATGTLQPVRYVDVGAQVSGQLRQLHVQVGSEVREGDLLAEIDADAAAARVDAYRASLRQQQANLVQQEVALEKARRDHERQRRLMADDATTAQELVDARSAALSAQAQVDATKAQIEQIEATMRVEQTNLGYTRIYAPISGTVVSVTARQGQTLNASQQAPTLLRVADLSLMSVQTQVSEADVGRLYAGMPAYFTTLGSQGRRWSGRLKQVEPTPTVTNNVVLYNAVFEVPNPQRELMTQMTAQVFFVARSAESVLTVPVAALQQRASALRDAPRGAPAASAARGERGERRGPPPAASASSAAGAPTAPGERGERRGLQAGSAAAAPAPSRPAAAGAAPQRPASAPAGRPPAGVDAAPEPRRGTAPLWGGREGEAPAGERRPRTPEGNDGGPRSDWQTMDPEQRAARRRERMAGGEGAPPPRADTAPQTPPPRAATPPAAPAAPAAAGATRAVDRGVWAGPAGATRAAVPQRAVVKVANEQGAIEEREVLVGIGNRVHVQILQGLNEGEKVVVGQRQPDGARPRGGDGSQERRAGAMGAAGMGAMGPGGPGGAIGPMGPGR
ncbi:efflux RND transporter periplasmic adaptor subunit [Rubrivivax sp. JA1055]|uniref:efflux RND transporter periplasmic adaptor subunit n=1 Tax=Rubrivivax sp. JA1055 TaxID=2894194 RepID=UPI001E397BD1|nr:efflux RND transporter periplasmic adaptor subunit [Rubrivivax sp. JA1055]MCC9596134.1 efflux RND transporter periplasmic adaptor subunit [Rubrivivax sp. JA1055]